MMMRILLKVLYKLEIFFYSIGKVKTKDVMQCLSFYACFIIIIIENESFHFHSHKLRIVFMVHLSLFDVFFANTLYSQLRLRMAYY